MNRRWIQAATLCAAALSTTTAWCFDKDPTQRLVTVTPQATPDQTVSDLRAAAAYLAANASTTNVWTWRFKPGRYVLNASLVYSGLKGVNMVVADPANPAQFIRDTVWDTAHSPEPLLQLRYCAKISITGFEFYGITQDFAPDAQLPSNQLPDQGAEFASCNDVTVDHNKFFNLGNAALRVETMQGDPITGVDSFNTVVTNNVFDNIYQISTTSNDPDHGGTAYYRLANNVFRRLHGSVKFATRTPGAHAVTIVNNLIDGSDHFGLEIVNYQNVSVLNNVIRNIRSVAVNVYADGDSQRMRSGFQWGDDFTISGNVLRNVGNGIVYNHQAFWDGYQNVPKNLKIQDNALDTVLGQLPTGWPSIYVTGNAVNGLNVSANRFYGIANGRLVSSIPANSTGVVLTPDNLLLASRPVHDLDGNLKSQVVWQQPSNSQLMQWPAPTVWNPDALLIPAGWTVTAMADIDGDGRADAILNNPATGQIAVMTTGQAGTRQALATLDSTWQLAAVGDFNGDGKADLVWRHANDTATVVWYLSQDASGNTVFTRATFQMDATWQLIGAADFDGDGKADLLWRQPNTANTAIWLMDGTAIKGKLAMALDASSYMVATGDFDGDGKSEILLRNPATGLVSIVYGAATAQPRIDTLAGPDPQTWRTGTVGDFNGDGRSDIVWRNASTGQVSIWSMQGSTVLGTTPVSGIDGSWVLIR